MNRTVPQMHDILTMIPIPAKPVCDDLDDVEAAEGDSFVFAIACDGDPKPVCKWTKDGAPVDTSKGNMAITEESGIYKLSFKELAMDDKGNYGAEFTNKAGEKKVSANLTVICELKRSFAFCFRSCFSRESFENEPWQKQEKENGSDFRLRVGRQKQ